MFECVCVCVKAWAHLAVPRTGTLPIHCHHPLILLYTSVLLLLSCFYFNRKPRLGRQGSLSPHPCPYLPRCDFSGRFGLRVYELHGDLWKSFTSVCGANQWGLDWIQLSWQKKVFYRSVLFKRSANYQQIWWNQTNNHFFCLSRRHIKSLKCAKELYDPESRSLICP